MGLRLGLMAALVILGVHYLLPVHSAVLAFVSNRDGHQEIYLLDIGRNLLYNLTQHAAQDDSPTWSPDGTQIAFWSNRNAQAGIYIMDVYSGAVRRLPLSAGATATNLAWSPDGTRLAFANHFSNQDTIYIVDADCRENCDNRVRRIVNLDANDTAPTWSPDGRELAYVSNWAWSSSWQVFLVGADGGNARELTRAGMFSAWPTWSPDGELIAFSSQRREARGWQIYVIKAECAGLLRVRCAAQRLTDAHDARGLAWSPDGRWIAFSSEFNGMRDIYLLDVTCIRVQDEAVRVDGEGCALRRLTQHPAYDIAPAWQP